MNFSDADVRTMLLKIELTIAQRKMSKKEFYEKSGVSSSLYSQWNTGTVKPTMKSIGRVAEALDLPVDFLLGISTEEKEKSPSEEDELLEELQMLRDLPERRALLHATRGLTADQVRQMAAFLEGMRNSGNDS